MRVWRLLQKQQFSNDHYSTTKGLSTRPWSLMLCSPDGQSVNTSQIEVDWICTLGDCWRRSCMSCMIHDGRGARITSLHTKGPDPVEWYVRRARSSTPCSIWWYRYRSIRYPNSSGWKKIFRDLSSTPCQSWGSICRWIHVFTSSDKA